MKKSGHGYKVFYRTIFPKLIEKIMPEGYIPSYTTFVTHVRKIKRSGIENYVKNSRGFANYREWEQIYDEFVASDLSAHKFFHERLHSHFKCSIKTFYKHIIDVRRKRMETQNLEAENTVSIVTLDESSLVKEKENEPVTFKEKLGIQNKDNPRKITVKFGMQTEISFDSLNPEYSVAKIIASLEKL